MKRMNKQGFPCERTFFLKLENYMEKKKVLYWVKITNQLVLQEYHVYF
jgi:hypothetical protein